MSCHTKIICTIGPAVDSYEQIVALIKAGMNVARLNFSHGTHEEHKMIIDHLKRARDEMGVPLAIMLDTKGPEVRIGKIEGGAIKLGSKERVKLGKQGIELKPPEVLKQLKVGTIVLLDEGYIPGVVVEQEEDSVVVEVNKGGLLKSGKGVSVPDVDLDLPAVTEKDIADIKFGCQEDVDVVAASFVRSAEHVVAIRKILEEEGKSETLVIAKIENKSGVHHLDSIVQVSDGIMIARGDLGVEVPLSQVPRLQKMMIRKCYLAGKPSVTATQMLESMIHSLRPTRAEASDVANAIYDSTSAVMLSGETAVGEYPIETVETMKQIIQAGEGDFDYQTFFNIHGAHTFHDVPSAVTYASVKTAFSSHAKAIFVFTNSGATARLVSRLRPSMPIIAMTPNRKSYHQLAFNWGVIPVFGEQSPSIEGAFEFLSCYALENKMVEKGDLIVVTAGSPFGISGSTNMMIVESIGAVLVRGLKGRGVSVKGEIAIVLSPEQKSPEEVRGKILLLTKCDESYLSLLREAEGFILQNHIEDRDSEQYAMQAAKDLGKSTLVRADAALRILKEAQLVELQPERALIYEIT